jgi:hypothetical protein
MLMPAGDDRGTVIPPDLRMSNPPIPSAIPNPASASDHQPGEPDVAPQISGPRNPSAAPRPA